MCAYSSMTFYQARIRVSLQSRHRPIPSRWPSLLCSHMNSPHLRVLTPGIHYSVPHLHSFVMLRTFYKWSHTACNLLRVFFCTQPNALDPTKLLYVSLVHSFLFHVTHGMGVKQFVQPPNYWWMFGVFQVLWQIQVLWKFLYRFGVHLNFLSSGINAQ